MRWWLPQLCLFVLAVVGSVAVVSVQPEAPSTSRSAAWWALTIVLHAPFGVILVFLAGGLIERVGYFSRGRAAAQPGRMPAHPTVCVQLPMFNEHAVARRLIETAAAMTWPIDRLTIQVLDDSTDADTRALVDSVCAQVRATTGVDCRVLRRDGREGYKAGALEIGRRATDAEFIVIFDADFLPPADYLVRAIPHFFHADGRPDDDLALVQAQWGHLNHDESALTRAQSLWVDDHHTLQMSWRSARWQFVNFTGTAGVWRASAIEHAGGWHAASLVEDCELSFRHLFAGYRTKFVKEIVAPAELPATYTAYKAQQKRWTQGWVQLQRLHLGTLVRRHRCSPIERVHLTYHMCIAWQWPVWALWTLLLPILIHTGHWFGVLGTATGLVVYVLPSALWLGVATVVASIETRHTYAATRAPKELARRVGRVVPYVLINTGMLPHQCTAFAQGLFGPMHSEFERTPKAATVTAATLTAGGATQAAPPDGRAQPARKHHVNIHWPYVLTETAFVLYLLGWAAVFATTGLPWCAAGAAGMAACMLGLMYFYGDHDGRVCFVISRRRARRPVEAWSTG